MAFISIFLISTGILALQILQTRIFSFTLWHHLAYMVITVALMGMGASGTWLAIKKKAPEKPYRFLAVSSILFSVSSLISLAIAVRIPLDTYMNDKALQLGYIFLYYMLLIFPYFFAGVTISFMFTHIKEKINVYYLANLAGSAIGGLLILPVMELTGGEGAVILILLIGVLSAIFFSIAGKDRAMIITGVIMAVIFTAFYPLKKVIFPISPCPSKALGDGYTLDPEQKIVFTEWNRVARIDVFENKNSQKFFNYFPELKNKIITIDGDAYTLLYDFPSEINKNLIYKDKKDYYKNYPRIGTSLYASAYHVHENPKVLVVGLGGGTDIITSLFHDPKSVTGVEINQSMIDVTQTHYADFIGNPYQDPRVEIVYSEGRSYIRRSSEKYDIIQMSGVDTWTALSSGAYVMSESYIYTTDAMREYLEHLTDHGTLSVIRWLFWPPREMLRLCTQAVKVLRDMGVKNPEKNIVVIGDSSLASILIKKTPFTWLELNEIIDQTNKTDNNRIVYAPGFSAGVDYYRPLYERFNFSDDIGQKYIKGGFAAYFKAVENGTDKKFMADYEYNIEPVSDDQPFFFRYYKWKHIFSSYYDHSSGSLVDSMPIGLLILSLSLIQAVFFSLMLIIMPLFFMTRKERTYSPLSQITYFFMIGTGFMFIEMSIIQQFVLFLGNPADAIAVTVMILLFFAGLGSLSSKKILIKLGEKNIYRTMIMLFPLIILLYAWIVPVFTHKLMFLSFSMRVIVSAFILAPLGFLLGQFFPTGLTIVGEKNSGFIPWAYAVNGVASVIASILAIILAMVYGFTFVFVLAAFCYFTASVTFYRFVKKHV